jgi:hypothetical protein
MSLKLKETVTKSHHLTEIRVFKMQEGIVSPGFVRHNTNQTISDISFPYTHPRARERMHERMQAHTCPIYIYIYIYTKLVW